VVEGPGSDAVADGRVRDGQASYVTSAGAVLGAFGALPGPSAVDVERETTDDAVAECAAYGEDYGAEGGD